MSGFRDAVQDDLHGVLNLDEFAEHHTVIYDGETYEDIPVVITGLHERTAASCKATMRRAIPCEPRYALRT